MTDLQKRQAKTFYHITVIISGGTLTVYFYSSNNFPERGDSVLSTTSKYL